MIHSKRVLTFTNTDVYQFDLEKIQQQLGLASKANPAAALEIYHTDCAPSYF